MYSDYVNVLFTCVFLENLELQLVKGGTKNHGVLSVVSIESTVYVLREALPYLDIYSHMLKYLRQIKLPMLPLVCQLAACERTRCVYIAQNRPSAVFIVCELNNTSISSSLSYTPRVQTRIHSMYGR